MSFEFKTDQLNALLLFAYDVHGKDFILVSLLEHKKSNAVIDRYAMADKSADIWKCVIISTSTNIFLQMYIFYVSFSLLKWH